MRIENRTYHREYESVDTLEVGISLSGSEVKSIRQGNLKLDNSFVKITEGEAFLYNAEIALYRFSPTQNYEATRPRKLLLHKKEITKLLTKIQSGGRLTIIPIVCYTKGSRIKLEVALSKPKGEIAKKKLERREDMKRAQQKEMKEYMKK